MSTKCSVVRSPLQQGLQSQPSSGVDGTRRVDGADRRVQRAEQMGTEVEQGTVLEAPAGGELGLHEGAVR